MAQQVANVLVVEVDGSKLPPSVELQSVVVDDALQLPDMFTITFRDPSKTAIEASKVKMGAKVKIGIRNDAEPAPKPLFEGEVTNIELFVDSAGRLVVVRGYDLSHRLHRGRVTAGYRNQTYADVAKKIAQRSGLQPGKIDATSPVHDHIAQTDQTDWDMLSSLASRVGFQVAVLGNKLDFRKPEKASVGGNSGGDLNVEEPLTLQVGSTLLRVHASIRATGQVSKVQARGWDTKTKRALVASAPVEAHRAKIGLRPGEVASAFGSPGWTVPALKFGTQAEIEREAKVTAELVGDEMAELDGVARGNPGLKPGVSVKLALAGKPFDGDYVLTTVRHTSDPQDGYVTQFKVSGKNDTLLELAGGANGNGNGKGGVVPGVVDSVKDPDNKCRVRLRFPWLAEDYVSDWSRISMIGAGGGRGFAWLPEPGDEVLVAFEEGDLARPYVVGGLFNGVDAPHSAPKLDGSTSAVNTRSLTSRKGNRITFHDAADKLGIEISGGGGKTLIELNEKDEKIRLICSGDIHILPNKTATIEGTDIEITARSSIKLNAPNVTVKADAQLELTGAMTTVKGTPLKLN